MKETASDRLANEQGCFFDDTTPKQIIEFIRKNCTVDDKPVTLLPWQEDLILQLWGWKYPDGADRYSRCTCFIPKKNGKSILLAWLGIAGLFLAPKPEIYILSSVKTSANTIFQLICDTVYGSKKLNDLLKITKDEITFKNKKQRGKIVKLSGADQGKRGQNASLVLVDEIADIESPTAWEGLWNAISGRPKYGKHISISHPQYNRRSLAYGIYRHAVDVADSIKIDTTLLPILYGLREEDDWTIPENWWPKIPAIEIITTKRYYLDEFNRVKDIPRELGNFRSELLGQWVESLNQWIPINKWDECYEDFKEEDLKDCPVWVAVDPAKYSLSAMVKIFEKNEKLYLVPNFWMPKETATDYDKRFGTNYMQWGDEKFNFLKLTEGNQSDPRALRKKIIEDAKKYNFHEIAYDANFEESRLLLQDEGIEAVEIAGTANVIGDATALFEKMIHEKRIVHNGHPILKYNLQNCQVKTDSRDRIIIDSDACGGRYDGISATITGLKLWLMKPKYVYQPPLFLDWQ